MIKCGNQVCFKVGQMIVLVSVLVLGSTCVHANCVRRMLGGELEDADYELECSGQLTRADIEERLRLESDYTVLRLVNCTLDMLIDPPAQQVTTVNLEHFELRNCTIGEWIDRFSHCPEHLLLDNVQLLKTDSWRLWHQEMQFASTVPFRYTLMRSEPLLRAIETFFPRLDGRTVPPRSLGIDLSYNDLSYWEDPENADSLDRLFQPFSQKADAGVDAEQVQIDELIIVNANLTQVPRLNVTVRGLLNLSGNYIRRASLSDFGSITLLDNAMIDLSDNLLQSDSIDESLQRQLGGRLIVKSYRNDYSTTTPSTTLRGVTAPPRTTRRRRTGMTNRTTTASSISSTLKTLPYFDIRGDVDSDTNANDASSYELTPNVAQADYVASNGTALTVESVGAENGSLSVTAVVAVLSGCLLITMLAVAGIVLFVHRHKMLRFKTKERVALPNGTAELDTARWDPEHGIVTVPFETLISPPHRFKDSKKTLRNASKNGVRQPKIVSFDTDSHQIDYVDLSDRNNDF